MIKLLSAVSFIVLLVIASMACKPRSYNQGEVQNANGLSGKSSTGPATVLLISGN